MDEPIGRAIESFEIQRLLALLPHRYPFLLVDRIIEARGDEYGVGIKNVTANEPQFQGHFPGRPVMPGVLLIEAMAQTAGALCVASQASKRRAERRLSDDGRQGEVPQARRSRRSGRFHMTRIAKRRNMWWFRGEARVDGALVCEAEISAMLVRNERRDPSDRLRRGRRAARRGRRDRPVLPCRAAG